MNRADILGRLANGEINVDEATRLIQNAQGSSTTGMDELPPNQPPPAEDAPRHHASGGDEKAKRHEPNKRRYLRIRVEKNAHEVVKIKVPLGMVTAGVRFGARFFPDFPHTDWDEVLRRVEGGDSVTLVEVDDDHDGDRVRIYVE
ncbi:MAG: hypothetical protein HS103_14375 [Anaerolineales bacterium]|nr:hypothetical protein [Anaerolineales bacterium]